jgi:dihydroorotase
MHAAADALAVGRHHPGTRLRADRRDVSGRFGLLADMVGVESGVTTLIDQGEGTEVIANRMLRPLFCLRAGRRYDAAAAPILSQAIAT